MTYNDWLVKITNTMAIRATDFRLTQNDVTTLANNIYEEVAIECAIDFLQQDVLIDSETDVYDLDTLYVLVDNELPLGVFSIKDEYGNDVSKFFADQGNNIFTVNHHIWEATDREFLKEYDGKIITFNRQIIPDIQALTSTQQTLLFNVILEGIMWYVHDSIPNPTSSTSPATETSNHYTMYQNAKKILKNQLPQRI